MSGANRQSSLKKMLFAIVAVIGCFFCFRDGFFLGNFSLLSMERTLPRLPVRRMAAVKFLSPPQILRRDELLLEEFDGLFTRVLRPDLTVRGSCRRIDMVSPKTHKANSVIWIKSHPVSSGYSFWEGQLYMDGEQVARKIRFRRN